MTLIGNELRSKKPLKGNTGISAFSDTFQIAFFHQDSYERVENNPSRNVRNHFDSYVSVLKIL